MSSFKFHKNWWTTDYAAHLRSVVVMLQLGAMKQLALLLHVASHCGGGVATGHRIQTQQGVEVTRELMNHLQLSPRLNGTRPKYYSDNDDH